MGRAGCAALLLVLGLAACASDGPARRSTDDASGQEHYSADSRFVPDSPGAFGDTAEPGAQEFDGRSPDVAIPALGGTADVTVALAVSGQEDQPASDQRSNISGEVLIHVEREGSAPLDLKVPIAHFQPILEVVDLLASQIPTAWRPFVTRRVNGLTFNGVQVVTVSGKHDGIVVRYAYVGSE